MPRKILQILMESVKWFLIRRIVCSLCWVETFWSMIDEFFSSFWNAKNRLLLISSCPVWIVRSVEKSTTATATQFTTQIESQVNTGNTSPCGQWKCERCSAAIWPWLCRCLWPCLFVVMGLGWWDGGGQVRGRDPNIRRDNVPSFSPRSPPATSHTDIQVQCRSNNYHVL